MFTLLFLFPIDKTKLPKLPLWIQKTIFTKPKYMIQLVLIKLLEKILS